MSSTEHTFVFADLAGYTALTEAHGDDDAAQVATRFHAVALACLLEGTRIVKTIGDAVMIVAPSIDDGIAAARQIAAAVAAQANFPAVRIGIHTGPAACRDGDYFGAAVNIAARVAAIARAGEIVCTEPVAQVAMTLGLSTARPMGTVRLKNVAAPVALFELGAGTLGPRLHHLDPVCRMQVDPLTATWLVHDTTRVYFCSTACRARFEEGPEVYLEPSVGADRAD